MYHEKVAIPVPKGVGYVTRQCLVLEPGKSVSREGSNACPDKGISRGNSRLYFHQSICRERTHGPIMYVTSSMS